MSKDDGLNLNDPDKPLVKEDRNSATDIYG